ncbi:MAG: hypothetical protein AB7E47_04240 [Desulfovibrionaceae bacterium]
MNIREILGMKRHIRHLGCPRCYRGFNEVTPYELHGVALFKCATCGITFCTRCGHMHRTVEILCPNDTESIRRLEDPDDVFDVHDVRRQGHVFRMIGEYYIG